MTERDLDKKIARNHLWTGEVIEIPDPPDSDESDAEDERESEDANERYLEVTVKPKTVVHAQPVQLG